MKAFRGVSLRPVSRDDLPLLYALLNDPDRIHLWGQRQHDDESEFLENWRRWSKQWIFDKFIVTSHDRPIGIVFDYERPIEDGHTKIATILSQQPVARGHGVVATALFSRWLFRWSRGDRHCDSDRRPARWARRLLRHQASRDQSY